MKQELSEPHQDDGKPTQDDVLSYQILGEPNYDDG